MRSILLLVCLVMLFSRCADSNSRKKEPPVETDSIASAAYGKFLEAKEGEAVSHEYDHLGKIMGVVEFSIPDTSFENGYQQWISLENPGPDLARLPDAGELLISAPEIRVAIEYPLKDEFIFTLKSNGAFTKGQLVQLISDQYHKIYKTEERSASVKTIPPKQRRGLYNRNETNGDFGIWGHDLSDLVLSRIRIHQSADGEIILSLDIES
ncbi:hypothetical protein LZZ85_17235 [Terrimonas sp. NA20]|uniref:Uncharacterized protein n=1 Tax=Terrimonas ginsenosidimutans TaxID=2908004 RepID=A0ABS9KUQ5_9BACT|nr:hypothetical protein [Terrimonas ginsenosidimutans]MCG2616043.1 hypothetical protein [Terrimonas ginsenosidimutans]